nr:translation initiation factor IF-2-like [Aegilops tauschii subsp. strangulata]
MSKPSPMPGRASRPKFPPVLFLYHQSPSALDLAAAKTRKLQRGKHHKAQHLRRRSIQAPDQRRPDLVSDESHHPAPAGGDQAPDPEGSDPRPTAHATTRSSGRTTPRARTPTAARCARRGQDPSAAPPHPAKVRRLLSNGRPAPAHSGEGEGSPAAAPAGLASPGGAAGGGEDGGDVGESGRRRLGFPPGRPRGRPEGYEPPSFIASTTSLQSDATTILEIYKSSANASASLTANASRAIRPSM